MMKDGLEVKLGEKKRKSSANLKCAGWVGLWDLGLLPGCRTWRPKGEMTSVEIFLWDLGLYFREFRRKQRKTLNKSDQELNPVPHVYQI